ncbi:cytochrome C oxidase subunit IV family protein [Marinobacter salinexigens]|uniref:Cytochrome C oxidase subunit IV family protein n=1 Tax=Marinobacter salinexigens TaxID=2919747 RepID=A0A5B0VMG8_9GAMM|nr:cytochrome C oxidase subunit IV family protein [Marinobacter salinexigens]KAA1175960.1 cytochrome C oxidase subunit IV family protein [Marinobacter salinexigens]
MNLTDNSLSARSSGKNLDRHWMILVGLTLLSAVIAEGAEPSLLITLVISSVIVIKARMIIVHFMELKGASPYIYYLITAYFYVFSILAILVWLFPEPLASLTTIR